MSATCRPFILHPLYYQARTQPSSSRMSAQLLGLSPAVNHTAPIQLRYDLTSWRHLVLLGQFLFLQAPPSLNSARRRPLFSSNCLVEPASRCGSRPACSHSPGLRPLIPPLSHCIQIERCDCHHQTSISNPDISLEVQPGISK